MTLGEAFVVDVEDARHWLGLAVGWVGGCCVAGQRLRLVLLLLRVLLLILWLGLVLGVILGLLVVTLCHGDDGIRLNSKRVLSIFV